VSSHRAQQIVDAVAAALRANTSLQAAVYTHRTLSLAENEQELPAVSVTLGDDSPEEGSLRKLASGLKLEVISFARADDEDALIRALLALRTQIHISMTTTPQFGLSFVWSVEYGGASAPSVDLSDRLSGSLVSTWIVHYYMELTDPQ